MSIDCVGISNIERRRGGNFQDNTVACLYSANRLIFKHDSGKPVHKLRPSPKCSFPVAQPNRRFLFPLDKLKTKRIRLILFSPFLYRASSYEPDNQVGSVTDACCSLFIWEIFSLVDMRDGIQETKSNCAT